MAQNGSNGGRTLTLRISGGTSRKLARRAAEAGEDVVTFASEIVERAVGRPTLDEILAPVRADFVKSGLSEPRIMKLGRKLVKKVRAAKRAIVPQN